MASPFDVAPPAWLQRETEQKPGQLGDVGGLLAGGLLNALQKQEPEKVRVQDPKTGEVSFVDKPNTEQTGLGGWLASRKGLKEGLAEARLNTDDPQWKLKAEQAKAQLWGQVTQNEIQYSSLKEHNQEMAAWQTAFPKAQKWLSATPDERKNMPTPDSGGSKQLQSAIEKTRQQDEILSYRKTQAETAKQNALNRSESTQIAIDLGKKFNKELLTVKDPAEMSRISRMVDKNGLPTPEAFEALGKAEKIATGKAAGAQSPLGKLEADYATAAKDPNTPKEVLDAYKNAIEKQTQKAADDVKISDVPGTDYLLFQSPKTGTFTVKNKKTGTEVKMTAKEMKEIADELPDTDPHKKQIIDRLTAMAVGKGEAAAPAPAAKSGVKVLSITPKGGEEKKVDEGKPAATAEPEPAASPQSQASMEFFDAVKKEQKKDRTSFIGNDAIRSLAKQLAERVPIKKDSDLLQIGGSTLYHSPQTAYYKALVEGKFKNLSGDQVWEYIMGLPEDEQRKMFQQALKDAKK